MKTELIKRACDIASNSHNTLRMMNVRMRWDDGCTLSLIPGVDKYHII